MPPRRSTPKMLHQAAEMRKAPTAEEKLLWLELRKMRTEGLHFRRQHAIGAFIADFCAPRQKLVIEVDGGQHAEQVEYDTMRTAWLEAQGFRVVRFRNEEVRRDPEGVGRRVYEMIHDRERRTEDFK